MTNSFRQILDKIETLAENVTNQQMATSFADKLNAQEALRVFNLLKTHEPEQLTNEDRMEAARILKFLLPEISTNEVFDRIDAIHQEEEQKQVKQTTQPQQQNPPLPQSNIHQ